MPTPTVSRLTLADGPAYLVPIAGPSARPALEWIAARYTSAEVLADGARWVPGAVIVPQSVAAAYCHELAAENGTPTQDVPACAGGSLADSLRALRSAMLADLGNPWAPCPALPADVVTGRHPSILGAAAVTWCSCANNADGSVTTMLCPLHADDDPCATMAAVTGRRRRGSIVRGTCSHCGWEAP